MIIFHKNDVAAFAGNFTYYWPFLTIPQRVGVFVASPSPDDTSNIAQEMGAGMATEMAFPVTEIKRGV